MHRFLVTTLAAAALASGAGAQTDQAGSATFVDSDGQTAGSATLLQTAAGVLIQVEIEGLPAESWVAFHIHEEGVCDPDDDFESAGGHFHAARADHGYLVDSGPHEGDMPNQYVPADGILRAHVFNSFVQLDGGEAAIRGLALMIHAEPDDYESQPSGDAGDRIACAVIE